MYYYYKVLNHYPGSPDSIGGVFMSEDSTLHIEYPAIYSLMKYATDTVLNRHNDINTIFCTTYKKAFKLGDVTTVGTIDFITYELHSDKAYISCKGSSKFTDIRNVIAQTH